MLQIFYGLRATDVVHDTLQEPVIARMLATEGIPDSGYYGGIRVEFYGCGKFSL